MTGFSERLGLEPTADAQSIRRAYARELKLIKRDADVHAFQALREAYEGALRGLGGDAAAQEPGPAPVAAARQPEAVDIDGLVSRLRGSMAEQALDHARMRGILLELMPASLAASEAFEIAIAELLVQGWRPGHEYLFAAACEIFLWDERRLPEYLEGFDALAGAIQDLKYLRSQPAQEREIHQRIIDELRREDLPGLADLGRNIVVAGQVVNTYPDLLALASAPHRLSAWREGMSAALERTRREARDRAAENRPLSIGQKMVLMLFVAMVGVLLMVAKWTRDDDILGTVPSSIPYLTPQHAENIGRYIGPVNFKEAVVYEVSLLKEGGIVQMKLISKKSTSEDEEKVANAIRWAAPFPADFPRTFRVMFPS